MTRAEAIELARRHAKLRPQSYYVEPFEPHAWVVEAILEAAGGEIVRRVDCEACDGTGFTFVEYAPLDPGGGS